MQMVKSNHLVTVGKFILQPQKSPLDQGGQSGNYLAESPHETGILTCEWKSSRAGAPGTWSDNNNNINITLADLSKTGHSVGIRAIMRPEETLYLQQVKNLGQLIKDSVGKKTTKVRQRLEMLKL